MLSNDNVNFSFLKVDHIDFPSLPNFAADKLNEGTIIDKCGLIKCSPVGGNCRILMLQATYCRTYSTIRVIFLFYCMKEMDIFSPFEVEVFVIYMYFIVSVISRFMPFILQLIFQ
jgi:hypothetical protein